MNGKREISKIKRAAGKDILQVDRCTDWWGTKVYKMEVQTLRPRIRPLQRRTFFGF